MLRYFLLSLVGSLVWSHLTAVLKSDDPMKQTLMEALPDDIISKDFEAEFWKYSSYSDYTVATGNGIHFLLWLICDVVHFYNAYYQFVCVCVCVCVCLRHGHCKPRRVTDFLNQILPPALCHG
jgi:hypothetical protein